MTPQTSDLRGLRVVVVGNEEVACTSVKHDVRASLRLAHGGDLKEHEQNSLTQ